ncbi:MAG: acyl carrier protein [Clostridia bacterium]|jgi:acyl carrier protein|nr:acyl carrier protein [Clostridia bacterium]MBQ5956247.1 acyl carrier protein [Clostridia bacterium]MBR0438733.1 acyl carrier protein [Clostridia bacterium]MBR3564470.1 acyl carrier protein [Clostridia bacterium]MBR6136227.1 acyl carrier protein [Clostridia bacterium]
MIFERLRTIICEQLAVDEEEVALYSNMYDDLYADSLDMVDISMKIEDEFGVWIPDDVLLTISTVGELVDYIEDNY